MSTPHPLTQQQTSQAPPEPPAPEVATGSAPANGVDEGADDKDGHTGLMPLHAQADLLEYVGSGERMQGLPLPLSAPRAARPTAETLSESFPAVVERYQAPLISFLYGMTGDREQAEDLAQDTFVKAYEAMARRHASQQFTSGWLFRIARNTAIDSLRRRRLLSWLPFGVEHEPALPTAGDFADQLAERELVQHVLALMPARYRECLLLRTVGGLSNAEIAVALKSTTRAVNTTLFRARERFRQIYHQLEDRPPDAEGTPPTSEQERGMP